MRKRSLLFFLFCALVAAPTVWGEVTDSAANGFTVTVTTEIPASPAEVYDKLVHHVGDWWSPVHTFSHDPHNLWIDEKPMGCFCEKLPDGGGVRHAEVINYVPGKTLVLSGVMGPFQKMGAAGALSFTITPAGNGSKLEATYAIGGYVAGGLDKWAPPVDKMLTDQMSRLKNYVETGKPTAAKSQ